MLAWPASKVLRSSSVALCGDQRMVNLVLPPGCSSKVNTESISIGQVGAIIPERDAASAGERHTRYKIALSVRRDWPIPNDSLARLTSTGLLADVAIGISEGKSKDAAAPGSELKGVENADIFTAVNELAAQLTELTRDQIAPLIKNLSQHVDSIASVIDKNTPELVEQSKALLHRLNAASDSIKPP